MKKITFIFLVASILSACQSIPLQLTLTPEATSTLPPINTPTVEPSPTATFTPKPISFSPEQLAAMSDEDKLAVAPEIDGYKPFRSAERYVLYESDEGERNMAYDLTTGEKVEIPQYQICTPEKFNDCVIPQEDLMSGKYWLWLNTLDVQFDPEKIKDVPIVSRQFKYGWVEVTEVYHDSGYDKPADFADPTTAPFDRDVTSGMVLYNVEGVESFGVVRPVAFYDKNTGHVNWVVAFQSHYDYHAETARDYRSPAYQVMWNHWGGYNVTPLMTNFYSVNTGLEDPILSHTYQAFPNMDECFANFAAGDLSALSAPGMVVQTSSNVKPVNNSYK